MSPHFTHHRIFLYFCFMLYMRSSYLYLSLYSSTLSGHPSSSLLFSVAKLNPAESSGKTWERKRKGESQAERQGPRILANLSTHSSTCAAGCPKESVTAIYLNQSCEVEQTYWHSRNGIAMKFHCPCSSFGPFWLDCLSLSRRVLCSNYCAKIWFLWFQIVCSNPQPFSWETTNLWNGCWKDSPCCWRPCGTLRGC